MPIVRPDQNSGATTPTGAAGGALAGTYPSPSLAISPFADTLATGVIASSIPRFAATTAAANGNSGTVFAVAVQLPKGKVVSSVGFVSSSTALATGTNQIFGLYDSGLNRLAVTADDTSTAWAAHTLKTLTLTAPYTTTYAGLHYLALLVVATTTPNLVGGGTMDAAIYGMTPSLAFKADTGVTALPATLTLSVVFQNAIYAQCS